MRHLTHRAVLLVALLALVGACSEPSEMEALDKLEVTEEAALHLTEAAVGPDAATVWDRRTGPPGLLGCTSTTSVMHLKGLFPESVLDDYAAAAQAAGGSAGSIGHVTVNGEPIASTRWLLLGDQYYTIDVGRDLGTQWLNRDLGETRLQIISACYEPGD